MNRKRKSLDNKNKREALIDKIRDRFIEKYGKDPQVIETINAELQKFVNAPSIKQKDMENVESMIKNIAGVSEKLKKKEIEDLSTKKKSKLPLEINNTAPINIQPPSLENNTNKIISEETTQDKNIIYDSPILFGKAINSDLNGLINSSIHKEKNLPHNQSNKDLTNSNNYLVQVSKSAVLQADTKLFYDILSPKNNINSVTTATSSIRNSLVDQEKIKRNKLWAKIQDHDIKKFIESEEERKKRLHDQQKEMSEYLAKQIEFKNQIKEQKIDLKNQSERKIVEDDLKVFKLKVEEKKRHLEAIREEAKKSKDEIDQILQEKFAQQRELKKIETEHRLEEENKYKKQLEEMKKIREKEKAMIREQQQKVIEQRANSLKELKKHELENEKYGLESTIQRQKKTEIETALFYENIRKRTENLNESKVLLTSNNIVVLNDLSINFKFGGNQTTQTTRKSNESIVNASLPIGLRNIDLEEKAKLDKEQREMITKQLELKQARLKDYKAQMSEQKDLWKIEEDIMEAREDFIKEMEKAKKVITKQELDKQIVEKEIEKKALYHPKEISINKKLFKKLDISGPRSERKAI